MKVIVPNGTIFSGKHFFFLFSFHGGEGGGNMVVMYVVIQLDETISRVMGVVYVAQRRSNCRANSCIASDGISPWTSRCFEIPEKSVSNFILSVNQKNDKRE